MRKQRRVTSVSFELAVLEYLNALAVREDRDRSYTVNSIIREHAQSHGHALRPAREPIASPSDPEGFASLVTPEGDG